MHSFCLQHFVFVFRPLQRGQYPATTSQSKFHIHNEFKQDWLKFDDKKPAMDTEAGTNRGHLVFLIANLLHNISFKNKTKCINPEVMENV